MRTPSPSDPPTSIDAVLVAIPARDEAATIVACLESIDRAAAHFGTPAILVVGADACTDDTAALARSTPTHHIRVDVVEGWWGNAGATRRIAVEHGLALLDGVERERIWIANTDADGQVPDDWLVQQLRLADAGADLVLGTVQLDATAPVVLVERFDDAYLVDPEGHRHVHAANLGIGASSYLAIGGWDPAGLVGEEHDLLARATSAGLVVARPGRAPITTSSRTSSRVLGGFATDLARLLDPAPAPASLIAAYSGSTGRSSPSREALSEDQLAPVVDARQRPDREPFRCQHGLQRRAGEVTGEQWPPSS